MVVPVWFWRLEMWLCERKSEEHSFCWRKGEEMGNKTESRRKKERENAHTHTQKRSRRRRRAGASDSGIHLIALKWKRFFLASPHSLCLKGKVKSHMRPSQSGDFSFSSMSANPSLWAVPSLIRLLILSNAAVRGRRTPEEATITLLFAHLPRPGRRRVSITFCWTSYCFLLFLSSWQISVFTLTLALAELSEVVISWYFGTTLLFYRRRLQ